jgi:hypothetical protein
MCESGIFLRGYLLIDQDTRLDLKITRKSRGLIVKRPYLLPPSFLGRSYRSSSTPAALVASGEGGLGV